MAQAELVRRGQAIMIIGITYQLDEAMLRHCCRVDHPRVKVDNQVLKVRCGAGQCEELSSKEQILCSMLLNSFTSWVAQFDKLHPSYAAH